MRLLSALTAASLVVATPAMATDYVIGTTGNSSVNGAYGNTRTFSATNGSSTINVMASGWQINQSTGAVTSAFLGDYSHGLGVTGLGDYNGNYNFHQVDNMRGYTDFILLQFDQAVTLDGLYLYSFLMSGQSSKDNDFAFFMLNLPSGGWNSVLDLTSAGLNSNDWTQVFRNGSNGLALTGASGASTQWLIAAGPNTYFNDGFKVYALKVSSAVPEPATWAMMLLGFGAMGVVARRRKRALALAAA